MTWNVLRFIAPAAVSAVLLSPAPLLAQAAKAEFQFNQYPVPMFHGGVKIPKGFTKDADGEWHDELGKPSFEPHVNFAGEYYLAVHSCGTCCAYYTLDNLRTGINNANVDMFFGGEPTPRTRDGHTYIPSLFFMPDSKLLIVQYHLDPCTQMERNQCRQRYFVFDHGDFHPISPTMYSCTHETVKPE